MRAVFRILEKHKGKNVVISTHGNIMVLIMNYFDKQYDFRFWQRLAMPDIYQLSFRSNELMAIERIWKEIE